MSSRPTTVLIVGATGSIGRPTVAEALRQGCRVRALVRDPARAGSLPDQAEIVVGDLARPDTRTIHDDPSRIVHERSGEEA